MSKTTNEFSPEMRERAGRLVLDNEAQHPSRWQAVMPVEARIGLPRVRCLESTRAKAQATRSTHAGERW